MLQKFNTNKEFEYQRLSAEEQSRRGILGRLVGVVADFKNPTRNGRRYTESLWDKTFEDPLVREKLETRCMLGELGHPKDRTDIDMEKVAICLAEQPKKGNDGKVYGVFDILNTPNGRILKALCDYGCKIGVSSRGEGDVTEDFSGNETVTPGTFDLECWDAVVLPAVKAARPNYVTESLESRKTLKRALTEALETATEEEKAVMEQTLNELDIDYSTEEEQVSESVDNIDTEPQVIEEEPAAAEDNGAQILTELQEALTAKAELEKQLKVLQEKLSVCYTKENRYSSYLTTRNSELAMQQKLTEDLTREVADLKQQLAESISKSSKQATVIGRQEEKITALQEKLTSQTSTKKTLTEDVSSKSKEVRRLTEELTTLKQSQLSLQEAFNREKASLTEELKEAKRDTQIVRSQATAQAEKSKKLVEKYQSIAKTAVDKYIDSQAVRLGINSKDIRSKLTENYSFNDIDRVCESLQNYKLNINSLPFNITKGKPVLMTVTEAPTKSNRIHNEGSMFDDTIDETLLQFIK